MSGLDVFALFVLLVLIAAGVAIWVLLGMLPGRIARQRNHPQADAINMCGWWGVLTMGILTPLAFIWAYTRPVFKPVNIGDEGNVSSSEGASVEKEAG